LSFKEEGNMMKKFQKLTLESDAEWFLLARKKLGMTQKEMAKALGVSSVTISNIENDRVKLRPVLKKRVLNLLREAKVID
jgi:DNA-binding XRE family transcriptional regulator